MSVVNAFLIARSFASLRLSFSFSSLSLAFSWYILVNPWVEEGFWRGALLGTGVQSLVGRHTALAIATLGFVPYHSAVIYLMFGADAWWFSIPVLLGSGLWVWMTRWRQSVIPAVVSHAMADLVLVALYVLYPEVA